MKVTVGPAHGQLDSRMQPAKVRGGRYDQAPPDGRVRVQQNDDDLAERTNTLTSGFFSWGRHMYGVFPRLYGPIFLQGQHISEVEVPNIHPKQSQRHIRSFFDWLLQGHSTTEIAKSGKEGGPGEF